MAFLKKLECFSWLSENNKKWDFCFRLTICIYMNIIIIVTSSWSMLKLLSSKHYALIVQASVMYFVTEPYFVIYN